MTRGLPTVPLHALFTLDVSAASGLVHRDGIVSVIADDALVVRQVQLDGTRLPDRPLVPGATGATLAKPVKPDLEALVDLGGGRLLALGSGSTPAREAAFRLDPAADPVRIELRDCYAALRATLGTLNIEGAARDGDRIVLAHRGAGRAPSALVVLDAAAIDRGAAPDAAQLAVVRLALPTLDGVPLSVTDLSVHPEGGLYFLATAEYTANAIDDGPVAGSVLGVFDARFEPRLLARFDPVIKAEGLAFWKHERGADHWLVVADPDDPAHRSPLYVLEMATGLV